MRRNRHLIIIAYSIVFLLLIAGCKDDGNGDTGTAPTTPFLGGTEGVQIGFLEGLPPAEVTDGNSFPFQAVVSLVNKGESTLAKEDVRVDLIGFLPLDFGVQDDTKLRNINPQDDPIPRQRDSEGNIIEAVDTYITFPEGDEFSFEDPIPGNTVFIFRADICYKYYTDVVAEICVLENMLDVPEDSICVPSGEKSVFSSGAPVQVKSFRQSPGGTDKVQFSFDIMHEGQGRVFEFDDRSIDFACPKDITNRRQKENRVKVTINTGIVGALNCNGLGSNGNQATGIIRLTNGMRTVTCTQNLDENRRDFRKNLDIKLEYSYSDSEDKEVLVKHLIG